ncbi:MAG TPA: hypothetical protein VGF82_21095 [Terracidiphilus sp.]|jgi:hypothetical protein
MKLRCYSKLSTTLVLAVFGFAAAQTSVATAQQPADSPSASSALQPYTAPDQSVTVGVPAGWKVTKGQYGVVQMSGPQGEAISLGNGLFVKNGPYQPGQKAMGPISLSIPYQTPLGQKYAIIWKEAAAASGDPSGRATLISSRVIPLGKIAECGVFLGSETDKQGSAKFETRFCSLPMDTNGIYKLFWMNARIPDALAAQERATAEAVLSSYKPSQTTLKLILQPSTPPMPPPNLGGGGGAGAGMSSAMYAARMADQSATCMDLGVIREVPERKLPDYCQ